MSEKPQTDIDKKLAELENRLLSQITAKDMEIARLQGELDRQREHRAPLPNEQREQLRDNLLGKATRRQKGKYRYEIRQVYVREEAEPGSDVIRRQTKEMAAAMSWRCDIAPDFSPTEHADANGKRLVASACAELVIASFNGGGVRGTLLPTETHVYAFENEVAAAA